MTYLGLKGGWNFLFPPPLHSTPGQEWSVETTVAKPNASPLSPICPLAVACGNASLVPMTYCLCVLQLKVTHSHSTSSPPADFLILIPQCCLLIRHVLQEVTEKETKGFLLSAYFFK